jgi:carboxypeptidase T
MRIKSFFVSLVFVSILLAALASTALARDLQQETVPDTAVVARVYFSDRADLDRLANQLDVWEVQHAKGYLLARLSPAQYDLLAQAGYRLEVDAARTAELNQPSQALPGQGPESIPGYPCYRTVEETYTDMAALAAAHPDLATWSDIGDSWEKVQDGNAGYDIFVLKLTNPAIPDPKPLPAGRNPCPRVRYSRDRRPVRRVFGGELRIGCGYHLAVGLLQYLYCDHDQSRWA